MTGRRLPLLALCGAALFFLTLVGLYEQSRDALEAFVAVAAVQVAVYFASVRLVGRAQPSRRAMVLIVAVAAAMRLSALFAPPSLSTDLYRYIWDGRVTAAGINPYHYIPTDPHLAQLRDPTIFPEINRNNYAPTIYPPAAQAVFFAVTRIDGSVTAMKAAMVAFETIAIMLIYRLLRGGGLPDTRLLVYAWHPLPVWEFAGSGHIDALLVALVALALWAGRRGAGGLTGLGLATATLTKLYPALLVPALWRRGDRLMPAVFAAVVVLGYLPFVAVGWRVFGFLPGYASEEGLRSGAGFYLLALIRLAVPSFPAWLYLAVAAAALAGLAIAVLFSRPGSNRDVVGAALLATTFTVLLSPHYPWYFAWLIIFACLLPWRSLLWLTGASLLLYLVPVGSQLVRDSHRLLVETAIYAPFAALAVFDWRNRRQVKHGTKRKAA